jgi:hypothetical protein
LVAHAIILALASACTPVSSNTAVEVSCYFKMFACLAKACAAKLVYDDGVPGVIKIAQTTGRKKVKIGRTTETEQEKALHLGISFL